MPPVEGDPTVFETTPGADPAPHRLYVTTHIAQAAYLACKGFQPQQCVRSERKTVSFQYEMNETLLAEVARFNAGLGQVPPMLYERVKVGLRREMDALLGQPWDGGVR